MKQYSIRGAITIADDTEEQIRENTVLMLKTILCENNISINDCSSIIFTATKDITKAYPAKYAREIGFTSCSLMCFQEMFVEHSLEKCIRVMLNINLDSMEFKAKHIYLKGAKVLRPDLI